MSDIELLHDGKHLQFVQRGTWEFVQRKGISGIVLVLPIKDNGEILLVEQFRPPVNANVVELCAGLAGDIPGQEDEALEVAAQRELIEECGYEAEEFVRLTEGPPAQGLCDEHLTFFKATGLHKVSEGGGDHTEDIIVHEVPAEGIHEWLEARRSTGVLIDPKIYSALYFLDK